MNKQIAWSSLPWDAVSRSAVQQIIRTSLNPKVCYLIYADSIMDLKKSQLNPLQTKIHISITLSRILGFPAHRPVYRGRKDLWGVSTPEDSNLHNIILPRK